MAHDDRNDYLKQACFRAPRKTKKRLPLHLLQHEPYKYNAKYDNDNGKQSGHTGIRLQVVVKLIIDVHDSSLGDNPVQQHGKVSSTCLLLRFVEIGLYAFNFAALLHGE